MEERMIIQSKRNSNFFKIIICVLLVVGIVGLLLRFVVSPAIIQGAENYKIEHTNKTINGKYYDYYISDKDKKIVYQKYNTSEDVMIIGSVICYVDVALILILLLFALAISKTEINITDKRVYGKTIFGKRVDLPLDSISAVSTGVLKGISVATSSGKIHFIGISNYKEIHEEISKLLIERQEKEKPIATTSIKQEIPQSNADELMKYKNLLDNGVITQEEFDAKKKQLLGL